MGARLLRRRCIVAVAGYGLPVRRRRLGWLVVPIVAVAACGGGGGGSSSFCTRLGAADEIAFRYTALDPSDPATYAASRDEITTQYVVALADLRKAAPSSLRPGIEEMETAVREGRFEDAADARGVVDDYAVKECPGRRVYELPTTTTSSVPTTSTTIPRAVSGQTTPGTRSTSTPTTARSSTPTTVRRTTATTAAR